MTRTEQDEMMVRWKGILDNMGIPFYLNQSTCLAIYRDGKNFDNNRSIDLAVLGSDLTKEKIDKLKLSYAFRGENPHVNEFGLMYFYEDKVEIQAVYFKNGKGYYDLGYPSCVWWPEKYLRKKNWEKIEYLGVKWNIPGYTDKYLAITYGDDWRTPRSNWYWLNDAKNLSFIKDL